MNRSKLPSSYLSIHPDPTLPRRNFILLSSNGARRELLLAILRSMPGIGKILCFAALGEGESQIKITETAIVIIDDGPDEKCFKQVIPLIRQWNHAALILLIVGHPREIFQDTLNRPDAVLSGDFSSTSLAKEIERLL